MRNNFISNQNEGKYPEFPIFIGIKQYKLYELFRQIVNRVHFFFFKRDDIRLLNLIKRPV